MSNHILPLLKTWYPQRDTRAWVLGTVYKTEGPTYRKPGAMMLLNDLGQKLGLLSGGCLEADIHRRAIYVMQTEQAMILCYDGSDESDVSFQLGIGCGGTVHILLQPVLAKNHYLALTEVHDRLVQHQSGFFWQAIPRQGEVKTRWLNANVSDSTLNSMSVRSTLVEDTDHTWLITPIKPPPHLLVIGGGVDAQPLVALAKTLGWEITLWDSRPANARQAYFPSADTLLRCSIQQLRDEPCLAHCDAAVVMSHNLLLDAEAISTLQQQPSIQYLALLGPKTRKERVFAIAGFTEDSLSIPVAGPAGLDLGAELPEGIALSILAECYAALHHTDPIGLSHLTTTPSTEEMLV